MDNIVFCLDKLLHIFKHRPDFFRRRALKILEQFKNLVSVVTASDSMTRGCPNHCSFCAVPVLEPHFHVTNSIVDQTGTIDEKYGSKQHLLLLDNNILNTADLKSLVDDLCKAGFGREAKYIDPVAYNIVIMRYRNGDRADFLNKKMATYLDGFKKRIKSAEMSESFLQIVIGAEDAVDYAQYMLDHDKELSPIIEK